MEYTDWYEHDVKPIYVGIYEIQDITNSSAVKRCFAYFDGSYFGYAVWSDDGIIDVETLYSDDVTCTKYTWTNMERWRGVKKET